MPISRCLFTCPVCGSATEPLIKGTNDENEDRSKLLGLVLGELDQQGVCSGCNAPLPSSAPCTFQDLKLNALVYVGFPIADALASWRSNPVSNRIPPMFVRSRLALKTAIARLSNFERTIVDQVPNGDWITIHSCPKQQTA